MTDAVVLIPAYNPGQELITLVRQLSGMNFFKTVVVDDGSIEDCKAVFAAVEQMKNVVVLRHAFNMGKGAALKSGLDHIYQAYPSIRSIVTADADGQHLAHNIVAVAEESLQHARSLVLGARKFDDQVPLRSMIGNKMTSCIVRLWGLSVSDTQTGLRGIPRVLIPKIIGIAYNRYEFEMEVLLLCKKLNVPIRELAIQTVYLNGNQSSHFNPIVDSVKIYFVLSRYLFASLITTVVDFTVFSFVLLYFNNIMASTYLSRFIALFVHYSLARRIVFHSRETISATLPKYLLLVLVSGFLSAVLVEYFTGSFHVSVLVAKMAAETILYLSNFLIQKEVVFGLEERS